MKHVVGVPHSDGTRIMVAAFWRVHVARSEVIVVEQIRIARSASLAPSERISGSPS